MSAFRTPVDLANRALQTLRQPAIYSFTDNSVQAIECGRVYDQIRLAELRRACWRFSTRRVILRPLNTTSFLLSPTAWDVATAYQPGDVVSYNFQYWSATAPTTGNIPGVVPDGGTLVWESYFGPLTVDVWNSPIEPQGSPNLAGRLSPASYFIGELVYTTPGDGTYTIWRSLISDNANDPQGIDEWINDTVYAADVLVTFNGTTYQSLNALNFNNQPDTATSNWTTTITSPTASNSWRVVDATLTSFNIAYPLGAGPASDNRTRNCYRLPNGFLRQARPIRKRGSIHFSAHPPAT